MKRKTIDIITLGCSKNLVDSEQLMRQLEEAGYDVTTPVIVTNMDAFKDMRKAAEGAVKAQENLLVIE